MRTTIMNSTLPRAAMFHLFEDPDPNNPAPVDFDLAKVLADPAAKAKLNEWAERDVAAGLKTKNSEVIGRLQQYRLEDKDGVEVYIDPQQAKEAIQFVATEGKDLPTKIQNAVKEATGSLERSVETLNNKVAEREQRIEAEVKARHSQKVGYELRDALRDSGIKPGKLPMHEMFISQFVQVEVENGVEKIVIRDKNGAVRYGKDGTMTIAEYINEYRDQDDIADDWKPDVKSGSGQGRGDPAPGGRRSGIDPNLPPETRLAMARQQSMAR